MADDIVKRLPLANVLAEWAPGSYDDRWTWDDEREWLWHCHREQMASLVADISANGVREPILLGDDGRVWDGHHRICAAIELNLTELPVAQHHRPQGGPS